MQSTAIRLGQLRYGLDCRLDALRDHTESPNGDDDIKVNQVETKALIKLSTSYKERAK